MTPEEEKMIEAAMALYKKYNDSGSLTPLTIEEKLRNRLAASKSIKKYSTQWSKIKSKTKIKINRRRIVYDPEISNKAGVYKIFYGDKFYIGRTKNIGNRVIGHQREINKYLKLKTCHRFHYLINVFLHIKENPDIVEFQLKLISECTTFGELHRKERALLQRNKTNKKCLNLGYSPKPYKYPHQLC